MGRRLLKTFPQIERELTGETPVFGWRFDATEEHATLVELRNAYVLPPDATHEDLFWIRHRVGMQLLDDMRLLTPEREQLMRSKVYWLWLRRHWLRYDQAYIRAATVSHPEAREAAGWDDAEYQRRRELAAQSGLARYEANALWWMRHHGYRPDRALLAVVAEHNQTTKD